MPERILLWDASSGCGQRLSSADPSARYPSPIRPSRRRSGWTSAAAALAAPSTGSLDELAGDSPWLPSGP